MKITSSLNRGSNPVQTIRPARKRLWLNRAIYNLNFEGFCQISQVKYSRTVDTCLFYTLLEPPLVPIIMQIYTTIFQFNNVFISFLRIKYFSTFSSGSSDRVKCASLKMISHNSYTSLTHGKLRNLHSFLQESKLGLLRITFL